MSWTQGKKVLVPVDFSEPSTNAVDQAIEVSGDVGMITVLNVVEPMPAFDYGAIYNDDIDKAHTTAAINALEKQFSPEKYKGLSIKTVTGDPAHSIAEYASEHDMELIVIPSHGRTGVKRLLIGSVAERVVRLSHCPVLVLRS